MTGSDSEIDKPLHGRPKRAELLDINVNTGAQSSRTLAMFGIKGLGLPD